jgi:phage-related minor tail protein
VKLSDRVELVERDMQKWRSQADAEMVRVREDLNEVRKHIKQFKEEIGNGSKKQIKETETLKKTITDMDKAIQLSLE